MFTERREGTALRDLDGIVVKLNYGTYGERWYNIRNPNCSQYERAVGAHAL